MRSGITKPDRGGLSGEHIQLCAEGARREPNLSGKWTEIFTRCNGVLQSSYRTAFLLVNNRKKVKLLCTENPWIQLDLLLVLTAKSLL